MSYFADLTLRIYFRTVKLVVNEYIEGRSLLIYPLSLTAPCTLTITLLLAVA